MEEIKIYLVERQRRDGIELVKIKKIKKELTTCKHKYLRCDTIELS